MDIYTLIVAGHVIGTILGVGGATVAELNIVQALKDKQVSTDERALMHVNYKMIRIGMYTILVSVVAMYAYALYNGDYSLFTNEKIWIKEIMFGAIFLNAALIKRRKIPLWLGASLSFTSWWGAALLGLAGTLPYDFLTYLLGYVVAVFVVAGILFIIRKVVGHVVPTQP